MPVAILLGNVLQITDVVLIEPDGGLVGIEGTDAMRVASECAVRLAGSKVRTRRICEWRLAARGSEWAAVGRAGHRLAAAGLGGPPAGHGDGDRSRVWGPLAP
jgi:hypothetical protein